MGRLLPPRFLFALALVPVTALLLSACGGSSSDAEESWESAPVIPELTDELKQRFLIDVAVADARGQNAEVFAKVGDSNTELPNNLYGFACRGVEFGEQQEVAPVVERYNRVVLDAAGGFGCEPVTSFSRYSAAARSGTYSIFPVNRIKDALIPFGGPDPFCYPEEIALDCEIRLIRPRYTIIMIGTNDLGFDINYTNFQPGSKSAERLALVVSRTRYAGSVPVLSNLPPSWVPVTPEIDEWGGIKLINRDIAKLAETLEVPLINLWGALTEEQMIDRGLGPDGVHLSVFGGPGQADALVNSVNLTDEALRYGANRRNLIWLQTLAELDRVASGG